MNRFNDFTCHRALRAIVQLVFLMVTFASLTACAAYPAVPVSSPSSFVPITLLDGQILSTAPGTTLYGVVNALSQAPGTSILIDAKEKFVIFSWPVKGIGTAWVQMRNTAEGFQQLVDAAGGKGNVANLDTWKNFVSYIERNGWSVAKPAVVSGPLITQLILAAGQAVVITAADALPSIILAPVITLPEYEQLIHGIETQS